jgi:hypothetical protein
MQWNDYLRADTLLNIMSLIKFSIAIVCFVTAYFSYKNVKGKKPLRMGDNQFFIEDNDRISPTSYYNSWRLVIICLLGGISFILYSLES